MSIVTELQARENGTSNHSEANDNDGNDEIQAQENSTVKVNADESTDYNQRKLKKKKKKKKHKPGVEAEQQPDEPDQDVCTAEAVLQPADDINLASTEEKKKKKKKRREIAVVAVEEPGTTEEVEHIPKKKRKVSSDKPEEEESRAEVKEEKRNRDESNEETLEESKKSEKKKKRQKENTEHEQEGQKNGQESQQAKDFLSLNSPQSVKPNTETINSSLEKKRKNVQAILNKMKSLDRIYRGKKPTYVKNAKCENSGDVESTSKETVDDMKKEDSETINPHSDRHLTKPLDKTNGNLEETVDGTEKKDKKSIDTLTDTKKKSHKKKKKRSIPSEKTVDGAGKEDTDTKPINPDKLTGMKKKRHNGRGKFVKYNNIIKQHYSATEDTADDTGNNNKTGVTLLIKKVSFKPYRYNGPNKSFSKTGSFTNGRKPNRATQRKITDGNAVKPEGKKGFTNAQRRSGPREQHLRTSNTAPRAPAPYRNAKKEPLNAHQMESAFQGFQGASIMNLPGYNMVHH